ncbi:Uncharacterized protein TPAR_05099 [Tolypocladium paradoxum]|uniref:RING-type E3 ubiquitin transferase n=1 Tax=Tolypocladium paradoxum TaxID=94208 RepID=A0A2S4KX08_9HYPO|nr:Uncharacterized protein TPAR_05099 [Tolypocladium paradoxum]
MFTQPVSSPPPGPQAATPVSPSRQSRLRGLSYLRNYTHNHLLSRDGGHHSSSSGSTSPGRTGGSLTRSVSYSHTSTVPAAQNPNRLTLVNSTPSATYATTATTTTTPPQRGAGASPRATPPEPIPNTADPQSGPAQALGAGVAADTIDEEQPAMTRTSAPATDAAAAATVTLDTTPSIRFSAYYDPRSTRPSLSFPPISRTLPNGSEVIRVGRYSERDGHAAGNMAGNQPSAAPVGFKSKVVSRRHCEFWYEDGRWFIRDVKSSSGTFLNHIRLSPPSQESKAYVVSDGDIVQLGIDFKGGEEMIFRCVKMRLELNRGWQNKLNTFNMAAHKRLRTMATNGVASSVSSSSSQDCSICLNSIAPCQSLFVAPCSHTWHFKCVRSLLTSPQYPSFVCPNCRAVAGLEDDVEEPSEWQQLGEGQEEGETPQPGAGQPQGTGASSPEPADVTVQDADAMDVTVNVSASDSPASRSTSIPHATTEPLPIRNPASGSGRANHLRVGRSPSPSTNGEGPITPRNNAGPWVFDGSAGRRVADATSEMRSLDAAAEMDLSGNIPSDDSSR